MDPAALIELGTDALGDASEPGRGEAGATSWADRRGLAKAEAKIAEWRQGIAWALQPDEEVLAITQALRIPTGLKFALAIPTFGLSYILALRNFVLCATSKRVLMFPRKHTDRLAEDLPWETVTLTRYWVGQSGTPAQGQLGIELRIEPKRRIKVYIPAGFFGAAHAFVGSVIQAGRSALPTSGA
jgi:hypothetical protein